jgi:hypothetical protein
VIRAGSSCRPRRELRRRPSSPPRPPSSRARWRRHSRCRAQARERPAVDGDRGRLPGARGLSVAARGPVAHAPGDRDLVPRVEGHAAVERAVVAEGQDQRLRRASGATARGRAGAGSGRSRRLRGRRSVVLPALHERGRAAQCEGAAGQAQDETGRDPRAGRAAAARRSRHAGGRAQRSKAQRRRRGARGRAHENGADRVHCGDERARLALALVLHDARRELLRAGPFEARAGRLDVVAEARQAGVRLREHAGPRAIDHPHLDEVPGRGCFGAEVHAGSADRRRGLDLRCEPGESPGDHATDAVMIDPETLGQGARR